MAKKCVLLFPCCCIASTVAHPLQDPANNAAFLQELAAETYPILLAAEGGKIQPPLLRRVRSPEGGNLNIEYSQTPDRGREAALQYNHNLLGSDDGRWNVDAYARGSRNFDYNRNDFGGGIRGSFRF